MSSFYLITKRLQLFRRKTFKAGCRGWICAFFAAYGDVTKAGVLVIAAAAKLCYGTDKINRIYVFRNNFAVVCGEICSASLEMQLAESAALTAEHSRIVCRGCESAVAANNYVVFRRRFIAGTEKDGCTVIVESFFAGWGIFFGVCRNHFYHRGKRQNPAKLLGLTGVDIADGYADFFRRNICFF